MQGFHSTLPREGLPIPPPIKVLPEQFPIPHPERQGDANLLTNQN